MNKLLFYVALAVALIACTKDDSDNYPREVKFTEYSLEGTDAEWIEQPFLGISDHSLYRIDSDQEMETHISGDYPAVDFSKKTLITINGAQSIKFVIVGVEQIEEKEYQLMIEKHHYPQDLPLDVYSGRAAVLVNKLPDDSYLSAYLVNTISSQTRAAGSLTDFYWSGGKQIPIQQTATFVKSGSGATFSTQGYENVGLTGKFFVEFKAGTQLSDVEKLAEENFVKILGEDEVLKGWYTLTCTESTVGNALEMANLFYESGLFKESAPDFTGAGHIECLDEDLYGRGLLWHWGNNKYNRDIHINYCNARAIVPQASSNVVVAIIDSGTMTDHYDIPNVEGGWDAHTNSSPNIISHYHGTFIAGLIGATPNNDETVMGNVAGGVAGIAHGVTILPVSFRVNDGGWIMSTDEMMKNAINYAAQRADVINCSWGYSEKPIIAAAIKNALDRGRVVVFCTGNDSQNEVDFPARSDSRIIAVGAVDRLGEKSSFSNYGAELDVVAPGEGVFSTTTDSSTGVILDSGTSYAAPIVAGVAALMLSRNPNLTAKQVTDIIEQTAQKINRTQYPYATEPRRFNGTWHNYVGYGLVDAYAAVQASMPNQPVTGGNIYSSSEGSTYDGQAVLLSYDQSPRGGNWNYAYQWQMRIYKPYWGMMDWVDIPATTAETLQLDHYAMSKETHFRRKVTSNGQTAYSNVLTFNPVYRIDGGFISGNETITRGSSATLTITSSSSGTNRTWEQSTDGITWASANGSPTASGFQTPSLYTRTLFRLRTSDSSGRTGYSNAHVVEVR